MPFVIRTILAAVAISFAAITWNTPAFSHDCENGTCNSHSHEHYYDHDDDHDDDRDEDYSKLGLIMGAAGVAVGGYALYVLHRDDFIGEGVSTFVEALDNAIPGKFFINGNITIGHQGLKFGVKY